ncbi:MAG: D-alanyl-D-alanine carboxypeptidase [Ruminococcus sp.]|nr:D-alanyl-D-alanine carboxypeptidase [Ruminococcus sp.]
MQKKLLIIAACFLVILTGCSKKSENKEKKPYYGIIPNYIYSKTKQKTAETTTAATTTTTTAQTTTTAASTTVVTETPTEPPVRYYKSAAVYAPKNDNIIFSDNLHESVSPASMTKIMTACVALKYIPTDTIFTVGTEQALVSPYSSMCYIAPGQQFTLYDLLTGLLLSSGNDAAYAIAVNTARIESGNSAMTDYEAVEYFCGFMNELAAELEMTNSTFSTPDGWDHHQQLTTVYDLLKLTKHSMKYKEIREITSLAEKDVTAVTGQTFNWKNSNRLLHEDDPYYCPYAVGTKTGSTVNAGNCLISQFYANATEYIIIVTGCPTDESRFEETLKLFNEFCVINSEVKNQN